MPISMGFRLLGARAIVQYFSCVLHGAVGKRGKGEIRAEHRTLVTVYVERTPSPSDAAVSKDPFYSNKSISLSPSF